MKSLVLGFLVVVAVGSVTPALGQVLNGGFETWTSGVPTGWTTNNIPMYATPVTQSNTAHSGSYALQGTVLNALGTSYPAFITTEFPISQRYASFTGWYRFTAVSGDSIRFLVTMFVHESPIGLASFALPGTGSSYTQFSRDVSYFLVGTPDSCFIEALIVGVAPADSPHVGSTMLLDDLSMTGTATAVGQQTSSPRTFALDQNYPNPFNPSTQISYTLPTAGHVRLTVYDILGRQVASILDEEEQAGNHRVRFTADGLSSGVYVYRLQSGAFVQQKRMMLLK